MAMRSHRHDTKLIGWYTNPTRVGRSEIGWYTNPTRVGRSESDLKAVSVRFVAQPYKLVHARSVAGVAASELPSADCEQS
eukprot:361394-Chlamydomonas_euryale.AAC.4